MSEIFGKECLNRQEWDCSWCPVYIEYKEKIGGGKMSLILKGIDMPHEEINLTITKDGRIYLDNKYHLIAEAIQVPKDHGRIGDLDKLQNAIKADIMGGLNYKYFIRNAPVILEVEGEK